VEPLGRAQPVGSAEGVLTSMAYSKEYAFLAWKRLRDEPASTQTAGPTACAADERAPLVGFVSFLPRASGQRQGRGSGGDPRRTAAPLGKLRPPGHPGEPGDPDKVRLGRREAPGRRRRARPKDSGGRELGVSSTGNLWPNWRRGWIGECSGRLIV
jgi:hypothetical protein